MQVCNMICVVKTIHKLNNSSLTMNFPTRPLKFHFRSYQHKHQNVHVISLYVSELSLISNPFFSSTNWRVKLCSVTMWGHLWSVPVVDHPCDRCMMVNMLQTFLADHLELLQGVSHLFCSLSECQGITDVYKYKQKLPLTSHISEHQPINK